MHFIDFILIYVKNNSELYVKVKRTFDDRERTPLNFLPATADEPFIHTLDQFSQMIRIRLHDLIKLCKLTQEIFNHTDAHNQQIYQLSGESSHSCIENKDSYHRETTEPDKHVSCSHFTIYRKKQKTFCLKNVIMKYVSLIFLGEMK